MVALKQQAGLQQLLLLNCRLGPPMTNQRLLRTLNSSWLSTENNSKERLRSAGKRRRIEAVDLNRPNISIFQFEKCSKLQHRFLASPEPLLWKPCSCSGTKWKTVTRCDIIGPSRESHYIDFLYLLWVLCLKYFTIPFYTLFGPLALLYTVSSYLLEYPSEESLLT